jgi:hypothetical protein
VTDVARLIRAIPFDFHRRFDYDVRVLSAQGVDIMAAKKKAAKKKPAAKKPAKRK